MNYDGQSCREYVLKNYLGKKVVHLDFTDLEVSCIEKLKAFVNNLEKYLNFTPTKFEVVNKNKLKVLMSKDWSYNPIMFSLYVTSFRAAILNCNDNFLRLVKTKNKVSIYGDSALNSAYIDFKKSIPLIKKMKEKGCNNIFTKSKKFFDLSASQLYAKFGIHAFINTNRWSDEEDIEIANFYLKRDYQIK